MPGGRKPNTKERYDEALEAFRRLGASWTAVARTIGVEPVTARKLWHHGWKQYPWARPIKLVLDEETAIARKLAADDARREILEKGTGIGATEIDREQERQAAIRTRSQEMRMVDVTRGNAIGLLGVVNQCLRGAMAIAGKVQKEMERLGTDPTAKVDPRTALAMFNRLAFIAKLSTDASGKVMEMERLRKGEPTAIFGMVPAADLTAEDAFDKLDHAASVRARAELLGLKPVAEQPEPEQLADVLPLKTGTGG